MNDTDSDDLEKLKNEIKALETRRYSKHYDPRDKLRTSHIKMTPLARFYLQILSQLEGKSQGQLIEEWATTRYAWKKYSGAMLNTTRKMKSTVRWWLLSELKAKEVTFLDHLSNNGEPLLWGKPYYYLRRIIEIIQLRLARLCLRIEVRIRLLFTRIREGRANKKI